MILLVLNIVGLLFFLFCTINVTGKFEEIFNDLLEGCALPSLTMALLSVPKAIFAVVFVAAIIALIIKELRIPNKKRTWAINLIVMFVGIMLFIVYIIALFLPLVRMPMGLGT